MNQAGDDIWVIVHLYDKGVMLSNQLNNHFVNLAQKYKHVKFVRGVAKVSCHPIVQFFWTSSSGAPSSPFLTVLFSNVFQTIQIKIFPLYLYIVMANLPSNGLVVATLDVIQN